MSTATQATAASDFLLSGFAIRGWFRQGMALLRNLGPYAAIELLLPGGSLIVVLVWLYRRHKGMSQKPSAS
jgi:hypothetical protein